jgi:hypothetical protein
MTEKKTTSSKSIVNQTAREFKVTMVIDHNGQSASKLSLQSQNQSLLIFNQHIFICLRRLDIRQPGLPMDFISYVRDIGVSKKHSQHNDDVL